MTTLPRATNWSFCCRSSTDMGSRWPPFVKLVLGLCIAVVMLQQVYIWRLGAKTEPSVSSALPGMHVIDKLQHVQGQDVTTTFRPKNISKPPKQPALRAANREGRQDAKPVRNKKRHGKFSGAEDLRIVFLHVRKTGGSTAWALLRKLLPKQYKDPCLCSIKSPPMYSTRCEEEARIEASNSTSSLGAAFASGSDIAQLGGVERILENAGYSQEWISDLSSHARSVMQDNFVAASQIFRALEARCPVVELHHWDISVASIFKAHGYKIMLVVRDPIARLESSFNYEFITAGKNGDRLSKLQENPALMDAERKAFQEWLLRQHSPQETLRMVSGCFLNSIDSFDAQHVAAQQRHMADKVEPWLPTPNFATSEHIGSQHWKSSLWASTRRHRLATSRLDPNLCLVNPTFDSGDQSSFDPAAVKAVEQHAKWVVETGIDFIGVIERWEDSLSLISAMFDIPHHLLDVEKKVNARHHVLEIGNELTPSQQEQLARQLGPDQEFYQFLLQRFEMQLSMIQSE